MIHQMPPRQFTYVLLLLKWVSRIKGGCQEMVQAEQGRGPVLLYVHTY